MARKKKEEPIEEIMETFDDSTLTETPKNEPIEEPVKEVAQVNMNNVAYAAFIELAKMNAFPNKNIDDFTLKEHREAIAHLKNIIRNQMQGDTFEPNAAYTALLCMFALCHASYFDLNKYFSVKTK